MKQTKEAKTTSTKTERRVQEKETSGIEGKGEGYGRERIRTATNAEERVHRPHRSHKKNPPHFASTSDHR